MEKNRKLVNFVRCDYTTPRLLSHAFLTFRIKNNIICTLTHLTHLTILYYNRNHNTNIIKYN